MACTTLPNIIWDAAVTTTAAVNIIFHRHHHDHHTPVVSPPHPTTRTTLPHLRATIRVRALAQEQHHSLPPAGTRPYRAPFSSDLELSAFQRPAQPPRAERTPLQCPTGVNAKHNNQTGAGERCIPSTIDKLEDDKEVTDQRGGEGRRGSGGRGKRRRRRRSRKMPRGEVPCGEAPCAEAPSGMATPKKHNNQPAFCFRLLLLLRSLLPSPPPPRSSLRSSPPPQ